MALVSCSACKRFSRVGVCPFCGARVVALAVGLTGCEPRQVQLYGAPPTPPTPPVAMDDASATNELDAGAAPAVQPDVSTNAARPAKDASPPSLPQRTAVPAYGLPPLREPPLPPKP